MISTWPSGFVSHAYLASGLVESTLRQAKSRIFRERSSSSVMHASWFFADRRPDRARVPIGKETPPVVGGAGIARRGAAGWVMDKWRRGGKQ